MLTKDIEKLKKAIAELESGKIGPYAARIRYYAALASKAAIRAEVPRTTSCMWDLEAMRKDGERL